MILHIEQVLNHYIKDLVRGDFSALQENMEWLVGATLRIAQVILMDDVKALKEISNMSNYIIKKDKCRNGKRRTFRIMCHKRNWTY